jgi:hypothetical protein
VDLFSRVYQGVGRGVGVVKGEESPPLPLTALTERRKKWKIVDREKKKMENRAKSPLF